MDEKMTRAEVAIRIDAVVEHNNHHDGWDSPMFVAIATLESGLDINHKNERTTGYGLFGLTKDAAEDHGYGDTIVSQTEAAMKYAYGRYKTASNALNFRIEKGFW